MECVIVAWIRAMVLMAHFRLLFGTTLGEGSTILSIVWYYLG